MANCPQCGLENWETGRILINSFTQSWAWGRNIYFQSASPGKQDEIYVNAQACRRCGFVEFYIDPESLK